MIQGPLGGEPNALTTAPLISKSRSRFFLQCDKCVWRVSVLIAVLRPNSRARSFVCPSVGLPGAVLRPVSDALLRGLRESGHDVAGDGCRSHGKPRILQLVWSGLGSRCS